MGDISVNKNTTHAHITFNIYIRLSNCSIPISKRIIVNHVVKHDKFIDFCHLNGASESFQK